MNDIQFWKTLLHPDVWTFANALFLNANDMLGLGHCVASAEYPCWANDQTHQRAPGTCNSGYSARGILRRLAERNVMGRYKAGSLAIYPNMRGFPDLGPVDKKYQHDPTDICKRGQKRLRLENGQRHFDLKNGEWIRHFGYILEDDFEACVDIHLDHIRSVHNCSCTSFCCPTGNPL